MARVTGLRAILLDIEGTTTPVSFVYQTLFPYARLKLRSYLEAQGRLPEYQSFVDLMDQDSKSTALKDVQGRIWEEGYATGELVGEVFEDVAPALRRWRARGLGVGIFSSGSALAQKLLFRHSSAGDLTPHLRWYFDTTVGPKTDPGSYQRIAASTALPPADLLFISDALPELDAARAAGVATALCIRPGNAQSSDGHGHSSIRSFDDLAI